MKSGGVQMDQSSVQVFLAWKNGTQQMRSLSLSTKCKDCCWMGLKQQFTVHLCLRTLQTTVCICILLLSIFVSH